jgi:hypothetical protein
MVMMSELVPIVKKRHQFTVGALKWLEKIVGATNAHFVWVDDGVITRYKNEKKEVLDGNHSVTGFVVNSKKMLVLPDINSSPLYNSNVDITSFYPVYTAPIVLRNPPAPGSPGSDDDDVVVAILQVALKQGGNRNDLYNLGLEDYFRDESNEHVLDDFTRFLKTCLQFDKNI